MTLVVVERTFPAPLTVDQVRQSIRDGRGCNQLYGVSHLGALLGPEGKGAVCFYRAPDAEAVRIQGHHQQAPLPYDRLWSATLHGPQGSEPLTAQPPQDGMVATVLVERSFTAPAVFEELQARLKARSWCLQAYGVSYVQSMLSLDRRRMLCLYTAPDAEAVRSVQSSAGVPFDQIATVAICAP